MQLSPVYVFVSRLVRAIKFRQRFESSFAPSTEIIDQVGEPKNISAINHLSTCDDPFNLRALKLAQYYQSTNRSTSRGTAQQPNSGVFSNSFVYRVLYFLITSQNVVTPTGTADAEC